MFSPEGSALLAIETYYIRVGNGKLALCRFIEAPDQIQESRFATA